MTMIRPYLKLLTHEDYDFLGTSLRSYSRVWNPDVTLAPDGTPYLFRWYLVDEKERGSVMLHFQVKSDPERPLHDHPWDNQSVILSGGYSEILQSDPPHGAVERVYRTIGETITRAGREAHRLILPEGVSYALTIFSTGPKIREWGFWYGDEWHNAKRHVSERSSRGQVSVHVGDMGALR